MLRVHDLSTDTRARLAHYGLDYLDHEHRQLVWRDLLPHASFMRLRGYTVLVPLPEDQCSFIEAKHLFLETHRPALVLLLNYRPVDHAQTHILAVCHWFPHEPFYVTTIFHHCTLITIIPTQGEQP